MTDFGDGHTVKFTWHRKSCFPKGYTRWVSEPIKKPLYGFYEGVKFSFTAEYSSGTNGPHTAFANISFINTFFTKSKFGFTLKKHFRGYNAWKKARAWCNYMLNNMPNYVERIEKE